MRRFLAHRGGSVALLAAVGFAVVLGVAALAVDIGSAYLAKRRLQTATDLAALAAASDLARAGDAAGANLARNADATLSTVEVGTYLADPALPPAARFSPGGAAPNAVRVASRGSAPKYFARAFADAAAFGLSARATAARADFAAFAIGSRLARLDGGVANAVLGGLLGANLSLTLLDYRALAGLKIDLGRFAERLAVRIGSPDASFETLAAARVRVSDAFAALDEAARAELRADAAGLAALAAVVRATASSIDRISVGPLLALGPAAKRPVGTGTLVTAGLSGLDGVSALAQAAGRGLSVRLNLGAATGLGAVTADLVLGEAPAGSGFVTVGAPGASVRTAQARLLINVDLLGSPGTVKLPLVLDVAYGRATLTALRCDADGRPSVTLGVQPGVVEAWIGSISAADLANLAVRPNPQRQALLDLGEIKVSGRARALVGSQAAQAVTFGAADVAAGTAKTTTTGELAAALLAALSRDLRLDVSVGGLGLSVGAETVVTDRLAAAAGALDALLTGLLATLGLGQADTWVTGVRCGGPVLVD